MIVHVLKSCDTCRKALAALREAGAALEVVDLRDDGVGCADLERFHAAFGAALVNRRSSTWRGLGDAERARDPLDLLAEHPALMKRPVIETDNGALYLGWDAAVQAAVLSNE